MKNIILFFINLFRSLFGKPKSVVNTNVELPPISVEEVKVKPTLNINRKDLKIKSALIILDFLKTNHSQSFTVKEIGDNCFNSSTFKLEHYHNVSEFLIFLNDYDMITFTFEGKEMKRSEFPNRLLGGLYQYKSGEGISSTEKILDLWIRTTSDFFKNEHRAYTTTQVARKLCGNDLRFIHTQTIVMKELEKRGEVIFSHMGEKTVKGDNNMNGTWIGKNWCVRRFVA